MYYETFHALYMYMVFSPREESIVLGLGMKHVENRLEDATCTRICSANMHPIRSSSFYTGHRVISIYLVSVSRGVALGSLWKNSCFWSFSRSLEILRFCWTKVTFST